MIRLEHRLPGFRAALDAEYERAFGPSTVPLAGDAAKGPAGSFARVERGTQAAVAAHG